MYVVYVQNQDGTPLEPTTRFGWVRRMLRDGHAIVVQRKPFVIRLMEMRENPVTRQYIGGTDPGRTNIGNAVVCREDARCVYRDHVETRNREIPRLMSDRKIARQASRRGERLKRKRRAKQHDTLSDVLVMDGGRMIPGCEKLVPVKDIVNQESRFLNRKRHCNTRDVVKSSSAWVTPSVKQLVQTHLNQADNIRRLYPVTDWCLELNRFAFMRMEDGTVRGVDFQTGRMKGYDSVEHYVFALQDGKCACCGKPLSDIHHVIPRHKGGSDGPDNRIGLCDDCHHKVHTGELDLDKAGERQKYGALSVLNQAILLIQLGLEERFGPNHVHTCFGYETKPAREMLDLPKDHDMDAAAIISACTGVEPSGIHEAAAYEVRQYRRQDRAIVQSQRERTYKLNGKTVAKNRKPREEQKGKALSQWYREQVRTAGQKRADRMLSHLKVTKSKRYYNRLGRIMAGATFLFEGERYVLSGQLTGGTYYRAVGQGSRNIPASACRMLTLNTGLVYL